MIPESHQRRNDIIPNQKLTEEVINQRFEEKIVQLTQEEYDALDPPVEGTIYLIVEEPE